MTEYKRKIIIFVVSVLVIIVMSFFMTENLYSDFVQGVVLLAAGFFAGNGVEWIGRGMRR